MAGIVIKCSCAHKAQDALHGAGMRLCNTDQKNQNATCTVCGVKHKVK
jgi:hypothetical protein